MPMRPILPHQCQGILAREPEYYTGLILRKLAIVHIYLLLRKG